MRLTNQSYANRGKNLEKIVTMSNEVYMKKGMAAVFKVPTPTKVLYKNMNGYRVPVKAFYDSKSWLDYVGVIDGKGVTFDAKETKNKTSFPLSNIKPHQVYAMKIWNKCGGISFLLVHFRTLDEYYLMPSESIIHSFEESLKGGRKSIPYKHFQKEAVRIHSGNGVYLDWWTAYKTYRGV